MASPHFQKYLLKLTTRDFSSQNIKGGSSSPGLGRGVYKMGTKANVKEEGSGGEATFLLWVVSREVIS